MVFWNKDLMFYEISPQTYWISVQKETLKRHLKNLKENKKFASEKSSGMLPNLVSSQVSNLIKRGPGVDLQLQKNKAINIDIAAKTIDKLVIKPGDEFSFWDLVGKITTKKGYLDGRVIKGDTVEPGMGGGLCNLANTIHLMVVHSPLEITELHTHSDALGPDNGNYVPFANGTSIAYNYLDYRFKNTTDQTMQLHVWVEDEKLYGELRSEKEFPTTYELVAEDHYFKKSGDKFYRYAKIYRQTNDRQTDKVLAKDLIWDNKSEVHYDYNYIPKELIKD